MTEFPAQMPSQLQEMPPEIVDFLKAMVWKRQMDLQEGLHGIIQWIYRGVMRPGMQSRLPLDSGAYKYWPYLVEDTKAWLAKQDAKKATPTGPAQ